MVSLLVGTMAEVAKLVIVFNCGSRDIGCGQSDGRNNGGGCQVAKMFNCGFRHIFCDQSDSHAE